MSGDAVRGGAVAGATRHVEFLEVLGRGGFGAVYLADVHGANGFVQRAAVKVLNTEMADMADIAARQRDEARLLARLQHHAIVRVFDLCELHGRPAVLMEYVEGVDCSVLLHQHGLPPRAALQVVATAASALDAAYNHPVDRGGAPLRVVHRDIKPANLLVSKHGGVKVLDFGVARGEFEREGRTESVQFGTARYMAPEQWLYGSVGHGVDLYALGVTLAELLAGQNLGRAPLQPEMFRSHIDATITGVLQPEWSAKTRTGLAHLLAGMLTHDPAERLDAAAVQDLAQGLADEIPGESLPRYAHRRVPALIEARRNKMRQFPLLDATPVSYPGQRPTRPDAVDSSALHSETGSRPGTLVSAGDLQQRVGVAEAARRIPEALARRAARLAERGAVSAASLAETIPPPDSTGGDAVPPAPVVPRPVESVLPTSDPTDQMDDLSSTLARQGRRLLARGVEGLSDRVLFNDSDVDSTAGRPLGWHGPSAVPPVPARVADAGTTSPDLSFGSRGPPGKPELRAPAPTVGPGSEPVEASTPTAFSQPQAPVLPVLSSDTAAGSSGGVTQPSGGRTRPSVRSGPSRAGRPVALGRWLASAVVCGVVAVAGAAYVASQTGFLGPPAVRDSLAAAEPAPGDRSAEASAEEGGPAVGPATRLPVASALATGPAEAPTRVVPPAYRPPEPKASRGVVRVSPSLSNGVPTAASSESSSPPAPKGVRDGLVASGASPPESVLLDLRVTSIPLNAVVYIDGVRVGNATPNAAFPVAPGAHLLRLELGEDAIEQTISVSDLRTNRFAWKRDDGVLLVHP